MYLPIRLGVQRIGALVAHGVRVSERMVDGCVALLALALEREKFVKLARTSEEIRTREEIKSTLLAMLAHDLKEEWYHRLLHSETAMAIQRRLQFEGVPSIVLAVRA